MGWRDRLDERFKTKWQRSVEASLARIEAHLGTLNQRSIEMAVDLTQLEGEVQRNTSVDESIKVLVMGLAAKIEELKQGADPATQARIDELVTALRNDNDKLAQFTQENTPADPARRG